MELKILENKPETANYFSLILEKPTDLFFYPGQYLDIELPIADSYGNVKAFTISSSPTEDFLIVTSKKGKSNFKKYMQSLKPGDLISTSHPAGTFTLDETTTAVFIAGGIGITPFRSMLKWTVDQKLMLPITLIYLNSDTDFPFREELDSWKQKLPDLNIIYHNSAKSGRLNKLPPIPYNLPIYYLAGPQNMVDEYGQKLLALGTDPLNIRYDRFDGYI